MNEQGIIKRLLFVRLARHKPKMEAPIQLSPMEVKLNVAIFGNSKVAEESYIAICRGNALSVIKRFHITISPVFIICILYLYNMSLYLYDMSIVSL
jgi:hypothetical protein